MKIGYGHFGEQPFHFTIKNPEQQTDVGFLKLFLSNKYHNLRGIEQPALDAKELSNRHKRDIGRSDISDYEPIWDTLTITVVQRRRK